MSNPDILLINPSDREKSYGELGKSFSAIEPPLWCGLIAAFIRKQGFSVKIIDADAEGWGVADTVEKIINITPRLIAFSVLGANPSASSTSKMTAVRAVLQTLKQKGIRIPSLLYGIHPSALPVQTLREETVDFVCKGESFYTILELLKVLQSQPREKKYRIKGLWYIQDNQVIDNGWGRLVENIDNLPVAAWDLLPMDKYRAHNWHCFGRLSQRIPYAVIYTSLGCPFHCTYCNIHALYDGKPGIRFRNPQKVVEEIDFLVKNYHVKNIKILDELFVLKQERVIELCDLLIQRSYDLNIWAYARIDTVNEVLLQKMKHAGINWLAYGVESGSEMVRADVAKGNLSQDAIRNAVSMTHNAGIHIVANFIFGLPEDDFKTMEETLKLAKELNCEYANFYVAMAYPGSQLYEEAVREGLRLPCTWSGYAQLSRETTPLPSKYLSSEEILRFRDRAFEQYYSDSAYWEMMEQKFGRETVNHIKEMLMCKIERKLLLRL